MPKALRKVKQKIIGKKGNTNALIEGSRDARQLQRASLRENKLAKMQTARAKQNQPKSMYNHRTCILYIQQGKKTKH